VGWNPRIEKNVITWYGFRGEAIIEIFPTDIEARARYEDFVRSGIVRRAQKQQKRGR
jgi:hypothetical protein